MTAIRKIVADNLRNWMIDNNTLGSQPKLAEKSGVSQSHIGRILREESSVTVDMLEDIARAFRKHPADLLRAQTLAEVHPLHGSDPPPPYLVPPLDQIVQAALHLTREGQHVLLGRAEELQARYGRQMETGN